MNICLSDILLNVAIANTWESETLDILAPPFLEIRLRIPELTTRLDHSPAISHAIDHDLSLALDPDEVVFRNLSSGLEDFPTIPCCKLKLTLNHL